MPRRLRFLRVLSALVLAVFACSFWGAAGVLVLVWPIAGLDWPWLVAAALTLPFSWLVGLGGVVLERVYLDARDYFELETCALRVSHERKRGTLSKERAMFPFDMQSVTNITEVLS